MMRRGGGLRGGVTILAAAVFAAGCSSEPPPEFDKGVSPFGPAASGTPVSLDSAVERESAVPVKLDSSLGSGLTEYRLRQAMSLGDRGDLVKAEQLIEEVLAAEPANREALYMRGVLALEQARKAEDAAERRRFLDRAAQVADKLALNYETLKAPELQLQIRVRVARLVMLTKEGQFEQAVEALARSIAHGYDILDRVKLMDDLEPLRQFAGYKTLLKKLEADRLVKARVATKEILAKPVDLKFDFNLTDLDNKPVALKDFKGKVVIVDFWGTWCGPCVQTIPHLVQLYKEKHDAGLEIVGLTYERDTKSPEEAGGVVREFVKKANIPYPCLIGDESTIKKIPGFKGFPTSLVIDRKGRVRLLILENDEHSFEQVRDVALVLLEEQ